MITAIHNSLRSKREQLEKDEKGFTLIELLVVVLIIGILAAIAIPVFLGQQDSAKDAAAKSDLANAKVAMIAYETANNGAFPATGPASPTLPGFTKSDNVTTVNIKSASSSGFCIEAQSTSSSTPFFHITDSGSVQTGNCP